MVRDTRTVVDEVRGWAAPDFVLPNGGGLGYGLFLPDARSLAWLAARAGEIPGWPHARQRVRDALGPGARGEAARPPICSSSSCAPARRDRRAERAAAARAGRAAVLAVHGCRAARGPRAARRGHPPRGLRTRRRAGSRTRGSGPWSRTALTGATLDFVAAVWRQDHVIDGLELGEPDYIALAQELAVRNVRGGRRSSTASSPASRTRIAARASRSCGRPCRPTPRCATPSSPRSPTPRTGSARRGCSRRWSTCTTRSAPRSPQRYVRPSLELLETIQRTGDIFFPKRWMDATLGGHASAAVADTVPRSSPSVPTTRRACGASSCSRPTSCSGPRGDPRGITA
jgi:aminopeptidase N